MNTVTKHIFEETVMDFRKVPKGVDPRTHTYCLHTPENSALQVARTEKFDKMCEDIVWGSESKKDFGELLRGAVVSFLPENRWHLQMLKNIVSIQWQLNRVGVTQSQLFLHRTSRGKLDLPQGVWDAMKLRPEASNLIADLEKAVKVYQNVTR